MGQAFVYQLDHGPTPPFLAYPSRTKPRTGKRWKRWKRTPRFDWTVLAILALVILGLKVVGV